MVREDDLRATFSALHQEEAPPRATTAAEVIQRGRAVRSRRRTIAVVGSGLATAGVVAVALAVLPGAAPVDPATPAPSTTSQLPPSTTRSAEPTQETPNPTTPQSGRTENPPATPPASEPPDTTAPGTPSTSLTKIPTSSSGQPVQSTPMTSR
ncbi:hypothetical protein [Lentzea sp. NPDC003310]|uniref:hypothetical protein n=1 Tax=Lentzea sp. NPDC003310 TaxID=3154447 RepID=UPI0033AA3299